MIECEFCKHTFTSKSNYNIHLKSAKFCLKLRGIESNKSFICSCCNKTYLTADILQKHYAICSNHYSYKQLNFLKKESKEQIELFEIQLDKVMNENKRLKNEHEKYEQKLKDLQDRYDKLTELVVTRPITINNNTTDNSTTHIRNNIIQNLQPITQNDLDIQANNLTVEHIKNGADGYVQFFLEFPLKDKLVCTDLSRKIVKYKNEDGILVTEPNMVNITKKAVSSIKNKKDELIQPLLDELTIRLTDNLRSIMEDSEPITSAEEKLFFMIIKDRRELNEIANGEQPELFDNIINKICQKVKL